jgi:hypothetical protein
MVQAAVLELRCSAECFGHEAVSDFKFFEDGKVWLHRVLIGGFL